MVCIIRTYQFYRTRDDCLRKHLSDNKKRPRREHYPVHDIFPHFGLLLWKWERKIVQKDLWFE